MEEGMEVGMERRPEGDCRVAALYAFPSNDSVTRRAQL